MNELSYVVDIHQQDKAVEVVTKEFNNFYLYEISPSWFNTDEKKENLFNMIEHQELNDRFISEELEEVDQLDYTLQEVKNFIDSL